MIGFIDLEANADTNATMRKKGVNKKRFCPNYGVRIGEVAE